MTRHVHAACVALFASLFAPILPGQVARRLSEIPVASSPRVPLPDSVSGRATTAELLGTLRADTALTGLSMVLKPSAAQTAALTQLLADQQDPSKADYHRWLTPREYGERFGLADGDIAILRNWLQGAGLRVDEVPESRNIIRFSGNAGDVAAAFGTTLSQYRDSAQSFYENGSPVQLPGSVAAVVQGVSGLSSYRLTPHHVRMTPQQIATAAASSARNGMASPQYTTTGTKGTVHYLVPWDFRQIYGINTLISGGFDGTGIKIGVIGQSAVDTQQLAYFQGKTGQPARMPAMVLVPNTGVSNRVAGDEAESELDLEYSGGSGPGASLQFIYTGCTAASSSTALSGTTNCGNDGVFTALSYAITNNVAPILSLSYGDCESSTTTLSSTLEPVLKQANAQGQTVLVSSGDAGAAACDQASGVTVATHGRTVSYPASSSYVTAVGGTQLNSDSSADWSGTNNGSLGSAAGYMNETTWNDTATFTQILSSGGGVSKVITMPSWQQPYVQPGAYFRMVPDVSFASSLAFHPYMACLGDATCTSGTGGFTPGSDGIGVGGTSVAAPSFAAMLAVVEQANGSTALGNLNPALYTFEAGTQASTVFHDITTGNNMVPCKAGGTLDCTSTGSMGYAAGQGYDLATGLGSISAPGLRTALQSVQKRAVTLLLRAIPQSIDITSPRLGDPFNITVNVLANSPVAATGTLSWKVDGIPYTATTSPALYNSQSFLPIFLKTLGTHTIDVTYSGDANYDPITASIAVTPLQAQPQVNVVLPSSTNIAPNTPASIFASVFAGAVEATGTVSLLVDGAPASPALPLGGTFTTDSVTFTLPGFAVAGRHSVVATYSGDALVQAGTSPTTFISVTPSATLQVTPSVQVTATPSTLQFGTPVTFTASVTSSGASTTATPTGYVTFSIDNKTFLPTVALNASGQASASYTYVPTVTSSSISTVTASYSGDNVFNATSGFATLFEPTPPAGGITLSLSTAAVTIPSTGTATLGLNLTSSNGFSGPVSFSSSVLSSSGATFSGCYVVSPGVVYLTPGSPASTVFSLALSTSSLCTKSAGVRMQSAAASEPRHHTAWSVALAIGVLCGALFRRRIHPRMLAMLVMACALGAAGCSSGGGSSSGTTTTTVPPPTTTPSTAGTYTIQIKATAQNTGASSSGTFVLAVQ